jgi:hypothetical protein
LNLFGDANITVLGNQYDNHIVGNRGSNTIQGGNGNDLIFTGGGADKVYGGQGNDKLVASSASSEFVDPTTANKNAALLSGGAGNDLIVDATTDGHIVNMTGGAGADKFKIAAMFEGDGPLNISAVITDLSYRASDVLDFTQIIKSNGDATALNDFKDLSAQPKASYAAGSYTFFLSSGELLSTATNTSQLDMDDKPTVGVSGTVTVAMTTLANVVGTSTTPGALDLTGGNTAYLDLFGDSASSELSKLIPLIEHNMFDLK